MCKFFIKTALFVPKIVLYGLFAFISVANAQSKVKLPELSSQRTSDLSLPDCRYQQRVELAMKANSLSLAKAVCMAVERHPRIASALATQRAQADMIKAAQGGYYPQVSANMGTNKGTGTDGSATTPRLSVKQMVYDFGKVSSGVDEARGQSERQKAALLGEVDDIIAKTGDAIIAILRLKALETSTLDNIKGIKKVSDIANSRAGAGISTQSDAIQAKSRLEAAYATLEEIQIEIKQQRVKLATLVGKAYENADLIDIDHSIFNDSLFRLKIDPKHIPSIMQANASKSVAEAQLSGADADMYPTISLEMSTEKTIRGYNPSTDKKRGTYNYVGVSIEQTLFSGGSRIAKKRYARQMVDSASFDISSALLDLNDQSNTLREGVEGTERKLKVLTARKSSIEQTRLLYQEQYTLGSRPVLDLLNAESEVYQANNDLVNATFDIKSSYLSYAIVTGNARRLFNLDPVISASLGSN